MHVMLKEAALQGLHFDVRQMLSYGASSLHVHAESSTSCMCLDIRLCLQHAADVPHAYMCCMRMMGCWRVHAQVHARLHKLDQEKARMDSAAMAAYATQVALRQLHHRSQADATASPPQSPPLSQAGVLAAHAMSSYACCAL